MDILKKVIKWFGNVLLSIGVFITIATLLLVVTGNTYVFRGIQLTYLKGKYTANIDDYVDFQNHTIKASTLPQPWQKHALFGKVTLTDRLQKELNTNDTVAFAIIKDGKLLYEQYFQGYQKNSNTNSFSMAKTLITMLYLKAVEDGYISSKNEAITVLLPEYKGNEFAENSTLADLSGMTAGYDWREDYYFPINPTAKAYYGNDLIGQILARDFNRASSTFQYSSGQTQLLTIALQRALKPHGLTISQYLQQSFWQPLGMQNKAFWSLDGSNEIEKGYCCVNASLLDFAKFGQLLLQDGEWQGKALLNKEHVKFMVTPNVAGFPTGYPQAYGHGLWTDMESPVPFYGLLGHLGQRVLVLPNENAIVVRLGKGKNYPKQTLGFHLEPDLGLYVTESKKVMDALGL